ncbi:hypothetical protein LSTR_LSTR009781 [Laodelphax striatellus]|uniref:PiggyBac transposable element-derived protein domain-containing protein n=1 Tax=Laodelphax striatellus TaxID=195883 RepID=A0A482XP62_LAOST|nr:hypothetical protein LSTR_LSTR009781 [Laodelphax striatellus]
MGRSKQNKNLPDDFLDLFKECSTGVEIPDGNISEVSDCDEPDDKIQFLKENAENIENILQNIADDPPQENVQPVLYNIGYRRRTDLYFELQFARTVTGVSLEEALDILLDSDGPAPDSIFITPPDPGVITDEDSGDEETGGSQLFFDEELIEHLVTESNKYAVFVNCPHPNITGNEVKCFIGILILSGYNTVANKRLYWDENGDTRNELVSNAIRRNRFEQILRFLHVADNNNVDVNDKMWKLRPLVQSLKAKFLDNFVPEQNLSYDESMTEWLWSYWYNKENRIPKSCPMRHKNLLKKESRGHCESAIVKEDGVLIAKWVDNSVVAMASNCLGVEPKSQVRRYSQKEKRTIQVQRPYLFSEYNNKMACHPFPTSDRGYEEGARRTEGHIVGELRSIDNSSLLFLLFFPSWSDVANCKQHLASEGSIYLGEESEGPSCPLERPMPETHPK